MSYASSDLQRVTKWRNRFRLSLLFISLILLAYHSAHALTIDEARRSGLAWLLKNQNGDGAMPSNFNLQIQATSAAIEAMQIGGLSKSPQFAQAVAWLSNAQAGSIDAKAWQSIQLNFVGRNGQSVAADIAAARNSFVGYIDTSGTTPAGKTSNGAFALWGNQVGDGANVIDTVLALNALRATKYTYSVNSSGLSDPSLDRTDASTALGCYVIPAQLTNGSWPYVLQHLAAPTTASYGALLPTALMLYELKMQLKEARLTSSCSADSKAATAITSAKTWLLSQQVSNTGFAERNPVSTNFEAPSILLTTFAIRALRPFADDGDSAATTAMNNARNWLVTQQQADGSWLHDTFVTARVLASLPAAVSGELTDFDNDGIPDKVEEQFGSDKTVADAKDKLSDDATGTAGETFIAFSQQATLRKNFSYCINPNGCSSPSTTTYELHSGMLPTGLVLNSTGAISGSPSVAGSYAFDYVAKEGSKTTNILGRIDVRDPTQPDPNKPIKHKYLPAILNLLLSP